MKKGLFTLLLLIITSLPALAAPTNTSGPWGIDAGGFKNLSTALASPSTIGKTVVISKPMAINNKTLPTNRSLKIIYGGRIDPAAGKTFDFNKQNPEAGDYQIIGGAGSVKGWTDVPVSWVGAIIDDGLDDASNIQKAIDSVYVSGGGIVRLRAGTYYLNSMHAIPGTSAYYLLDAKDKVSVKGAGPSTILKAGPGLRTSTAGMAILYNHTQYISDLTISDMTVDYNGQNNLIQNGWSSTSNISRMGGQIAHNVTIARVHFKNVSGHHGVWFGDTVTDPRNGNNKVTECIFEEVCDAIPGNMSADFSGVYSYGDNSEITNNKFLNSVQSYKATAIEFGGNNVVATGNTVANYGTGVNSAAIFAASFGMSITGNSLYNVAYGIVLWTGYPNYDVDGVTLLAPNTNYTLNDLVISGNTVRVLDTQGTIYGYSKGIIYNGTPDQSTANSSNWSITGNTISMNLNGLVAYNNTTSGIELNPISNLTITGNTISYFKGEGIRLANTAPTSARSFNNVVIANNAIKSCGYTDQTASKVGIYIGNNTAVASSGLSITGNTITGGTVGTATAMEYGIAFAYGGRPNYTTIKGNNVIGATIFDMYITSFASTPYYFMIDHVATTSGSPRSYRVAATPGGQWVDSTTNYTYSARNVLSGTTSLGETPWLADIIVSGTPQSTVPYNTATWAKGSRAVPGDGYIAVGSPKAWICTVSGTGGTLAGVTGGITTGTKALVVNTAAGLSIGNYITIAGVTGVKQIVTISGTTVTLDTTASATVAGAAVTYQPHTWVSEGNL